ncbi:hypothetical protein [Actinomadura harenae]|uniref:hypothetical protein n=1 Tax=Actinomadura harenae TaxID=2483351 RepID=UPI0011C36C6F|nr:hypothetical protein [Actinomadura harenae]
MTDKIVPDEVLAGSERLIVEAVDRLQEALSYGRDATEWDWPRMVLYRLADAQDVIGWVVGLHAAHAVQTGWSSDTVRGYLQTGQQVRRAEIPQQRDFDYLAGLTDEPAENEMSGPYITGKIQRRSIGKSAPHREWALACIPQRAEPGERRRAGPSARCRQRQGPPALLNHDARGPGAGARRAELTDPRAPESAGPTLRPAVLTWRERPRRWGCRDRLDPGWERVDVTPWCGRPCPRSSTRLHGRT